MRRIATYGVFVLSLILAVGAAAPVAGAAALNTGWTAPYSGTPQYLGQAPTEAKQSWY